MTEISSDTHSTKLFPKGRLANDSLSDVPPIFSFNEEDDYAEIQEEEPEREANEIVTGPLSDEAQLKMEVIESLLVSCDRKTYGQKLGKQQINSENPFGVSSDSSTSTRKRVYLPSRILHVLTRVATALALTGNSSLLIPTSKETKAVGK